MAATVAPVAGHRPGVNPLVDPADTPLPPPCALVVFGASGDLAARKLLPALARLSARGELPGRFAVVGVARTPWTDDDFRRAALGPDVRADPGVAADGHQAAWRDLVTGFRYVSGDYGDGATFERLAATLAEVDRDRGTDGNRLYYMAVPPTVLPTIIGALGRHELHRAPGGADGSFVRIVVEKPYGTDLHSAEDLDRCLHAVFDESQIFRIDHFLGKETVQNVLALRFANAVFEPVWNRRYVDSVQITVAESEGVGHRSAFYEQTGALRDMVQNHVMQVLALTLMEPPIAIDPEGIRDEKVKALRAVRIPDVRDVPEMCVRGQYAEGWVAGRTVPGYLGEPGMAPTSAVETYVALKLWVDNWRWAGVPFYVRTGKRLPKRVSEVAIRFDAAPDAPFGPDRIRSLEPDALVVRIHPDEGVMLVFGTKVPGRGFDVRPVAMEFLYGTAFPDGTREPYERLLVDALMGDPTLFIRTDEVIQAWRIVAPILEAWATDEPPLAPYRAGTWGPIDADALIRRDGRHWRNPWIASRVLGLWSAADAGVGDGERAIRRIRAGDPAGSQRNAAVSLLALVDDDGRAAIAALRTTDALSRRVPGRFVVVCIAPDRPSGTRTSITVSLVERDRSGPLCVEHVRLYVNGGAVAYLGSIVEPWILPGLPVAVWLPGRLPRPSDTVVARADHVIVDSVRLGHPISAHDLAELGELASTDLAWIRLRPWRVLLADAFTGADVSPFVRGVEHVDITGTRPWSTLLAGWLMSRLELSPSSIRLVDGNPPAVRVRSRRRARRAELVAEAGGVGHVRVETKVPGRATRRHVAALPERLLVDDLVDALRSPPGPDPTWLRAVTSSLTLADFR